MKHLLENGVEIALAAGRIVLGHYRKTDLAVQLKQDRSPLTAADLESHYYITERLSRCSPDPIISEEAPIPHEQRQAWKRFWLVDPLDGTKDFLAGTDDFTINIALIEDQTPIMGIVAVPALGLIYYAANGLGAFKQTADGTERICNTREGPASTCAESRFHASAQTKEFCQRHGIATLLACGSATKLCKIAEGEIDVYPRFKPTMEWDTAAGHAILLEARGKLIDMVTKTELRYNKESLINNGFIASRHNLTLE